jgi:hypothetical protein
LQRHPRDPNAQIVGSIGWLTGGRLKMFIVTIFNLAKLRAEF